MQRLFQGWAFAREPKSYKDPERYPPDEVAVLKLGEHELSGTFHPIVTISCEGAVIVKLRFDVSRRERSTPFLPTAPEFMREIREANR